MSTHLVRERVEVERYLGLSLGGAKSDRTCLAVVDHYVRQDKAFLIDVFQGIGPELTHAEGRRHELTSDEVLLDLVREHQPGIKVMAVDVPLTLPPCVAGCDPECEGYSKCKRPEVRWMRQQYRRAKEKHPKLKFFTPYTQRPVDLYFRYRHFDEEMFQDETMGANLAPKAARMQYLKLHLKGIHLVETWPKLVLYHLQKPLHMTHGDVLHYRDLERGAHVRERILDRLVEKSHVFVYDRDLKKVIRDTAPFDALICAWVGLQYGRNRVMKFRSDLPLESGWVQIPEL